MTSRVLTIKLKTTDAMVLYVNGLALVMPSVTPTVCLFTVDEPCTILEKKKPFLQPYTIWMTL